VDVGTISDTESTADLVRRIIAGNPQAEAELVERYNRGVTFIIRREAAAEDLIQDTFRIALEKIRRGDVREPDKLSGFICGIARNLVIDYFRRAEREDSLTKIEEAKLLLDPAPNPEKELLRRDLARIVRQVINELPRERDRQVIFRFYIKEEEKQEICKDLGLTSLHFNRVLFRALQRFKELYEKFVNRQ
jgi:RNA polymerase sigma-70 factor, ECF subfamily